MIRQLAGIAGWYAKASVRLLLRCFRESSATVVNYFTDRRLGIDTFGEVEAPASEGRFGDAEVYGASDYREIRRALAFVKPGPEDVFVDIGCGKGRVLFLWAQAGLKKVSGVELRAAFAETARRNLTKLPPGSSEVRVVTADAADFAFTDETVVFLYNSFGYRSTRALLDALAESRRRAPRRVRLVYFGPYADMIDAEPGASEGARVPGTDIRVWSFER